jgi:hypothetical protein
MTWKQRTLFGPGAIPPAARASDPETSHQAARDNPLHKAADRRRVLLIHAQHPAGLTDFELAELCAGQQTSLGKRRGELRDAGLIVNAGIRRPAPSGSLAIVWKITPRGLSTIEEAKQR